MGAEDNTIRGVCSFLSVPTFGAYFRGALDGSHRSHSSGGVECSIVLASHLMPA